MTTRKPETKHRHQWKPTKDTAYRRWKCTHVVDECNKPAVVMCVCGDAQCKRHSKPPAKRKPFRRWAAGVDHHGVYLAYDGRRRSVLEFAVMLNAARVTLPGRGGK